MTDPTRIGSAPRLPQTTPTTQAERTKESERRPDSAGGLSLAEILRLRQGIAFPPTAPGADADPLRFSPHAQTRLQSRHIDLQAGELNRLKSAVGRAASK